MRLLKKKQEEEERQRLEKLRLTEERKMVKVEKTEMSQKSDESSHLAELKRQEELKLLERQRLEQMIYQESKTIKSGQVSKRSDDVHGLGWGNVTTGFVSKKKLGFLQRDISMERDSNEGSPAPGFGSRTRGLRVTFADSPGGSRPGSGVGWTERVAEMDSQSMRAQTPPLAGEWAVSKGSKSEFVANGSSSLVQTHGSGDIQSSSFQSNGASQMQSSQMSKSMSSSQQASSFQSSQTSSFASTQKSSFSSSQSSSFQSSSIQASKAFEAFPGMGGIENLKLEEGEH